MKKLISIILAIYMLLSMSCFVCYAQAVNDLDIAKQNMRAFGFSEKAIEDLPDTEILKYLNVENSQKDETFFKITPKNIAENELMTLTLDDCVVEEVSKEEAMNPIVTYGTIGSSYMMIERWCNQVSGREYFISARYEWLTEPFFQLRDYFAVTVSSNMSLTPNTVYTVEKHDNVSIYNGGEVEEVWYEDSLQKSGVGGYAMSVSIIPDTDYETNYNFRGYMSFNAKVGQISSTNQINVYTTYAHQTLVPSFNVGISLPAGACASITPASSFDFAQAYSTFYHYE